MFRNYLAITLALVGFLLAAPWLSGAEHGEFALSLLWIAVTVSVVALSRPRPWERSAALAVGALFALVQLADHGRGDPLAQGLQSLCALALLLAALRVLLRHLWSATQVRGNEILAAISLMLLLALLWGALYDGLARLPLEPQAFAGLSPRESSTGFFQDARSSELVYFSLVTLTTVGYGDITPLHPLARSLAALEALCGQLYVAILVARLMFLHLSERSDRPDAVG
jgi:hypothetical protein